MTVKRESDAGRRTFRSCMTEVAQLLGIEVADSFLTRDIANMLRKSLSKQATLPEELFDPMMAEAVYEPDASWSRWLVEPGLNLFGRRRVCAALIEYLRTGTDTEQAGAVRAWYRTGHKISSRPGGKCRCRYSSQAPTCRFVLNSYGCSRAHARTTSRGFTIVHPRNRQSERRPAHRPMGRRHRHGIRCETGFHKPNRRGFSLKSRQSR